MTDPNTNDAVQINVHWGIDYSQPALPVNQFVVQGGASLIDGAISDEIVLTFGHLTPPFMPQFQNESEARSYAANQLAIVASVGRFSMSAARVRELRDSLTQVLNAVSPPE